MTHQIVAHNFAPADFALAPSVLAACAFGATDVVCAHDGLALIDGPLPDGPEERPIACDDGILRRARIRTLGDNGLPILERNGIRIVAIEPIAGPAVDTVDWSAFALALLLEEAAIAENFFVHLLNHCASRDVGGQKLSALSSIRLRLAGVAQDLALVRAMVDSAERDDLRAIRRAAGLRLIGAVDQLIKSAGARSMLTGGLVEAQFLFSLFNRLYL